MPTRHSPRSPAPPAATDWPSRLREAGLRCTALTVAVLEHLENAGQPRSHDELARDLGVAAAAGKIDRVTLYRILDRLTTAGLVTRIQGSDRASRHAIAQQQNSAGYFECDRCHSISALPEDAELAGVLARIERRLSRRGVHSTNSAVTIHGTCRDCSTHRA
ncbi:Fur family transcriptional regulator [Paraburkholderia caballeronis]|uniref:Fur family transcriptional regulator n=1 Tax=Paraburkholderia caballeronis TaxID=416943 RepID=UPI00089B269C|nr:transcriptional repressor [Paraburkholderia caballeronis]SEE77439.1 Fur family transcriptional regulator, ferric uptake regulator [Paraburkholderia caballeronis]